MTEMRIALASDAPAIQTLLEKMLRAEGIVTECLSLKNNDEAIRAVKKNAALLIVCTGHETLEQSYPLISRLLKDEVPVVCVTAGEENGRLLKGKSGLSLLSFPEPWGEKEADLFRKELLVRLKAGYGYRKEAPPRERSGHPSRWLVGIGASTGGPRALLTVLRCLPEDCGGVLVVQHLTRGFSARFAAYLDGLCRMRVKEARPEELIRDGTVYLAPDGRQMSVERDRRGFVLKVRADGRVGGFCPSVDCLFQSLAQSAGERAMGVILTGMGRDGAEGLLLMRRAGAYTVGQDRASSDIYSMPGEAMLCGGVERQLPLGLIGGEIRAYNKRMREELGGITDGTIDFSGR